VLSDTELWHAVIMAGHGSALFPLNIPLPNIFAGNDHLNFKRLADGINFW